MKIVSWNMAYNTLPQHHDDAWRYLLDELSPDIALVQEVVVPEDVRNSRVCVFTPPTRPVWGSAVIASGRAAQHDLPPESLLHRFRSRVSVASVEIGDGPALVASVHPSTHPVSGTTLDGVDRPAVATPDGGLWEADIVYAGLHELTIPGQRFVIGGDWMETWLWDKIYGTTSHGQFFQRASEDGWVEATSHYFGASEMDLRTWYGSRNGKSTPYQLDRIFVDRELATRISGCDVIAHPAQCLGLSDHAPLILEVAE